MHALIKVLFGFLMDLISRLQFWSHFVSSLISKPSFEVGMKRNNELDRTLAATPSFRGLRRSIRQAPERKKIIDVITGNGMLEEFNTLRQPQTLVSVFYILRSIVFIIIIVMLIPYATSFGILAAIVAFIPLSLLLSRSIRSLGNQAHDGDHKNISRNKMFKNQWLNRILRKLDICPKHIINDILFKYVLCPILFYDPVLFDIDHRSHHNEIGTNTQDLEKVEFKYPLFISYNTIISFIGLILPYVFNYQYWRSSVFADLTKMACRRLFFTLSWWVLLLTLILIAAGGKAVMTFLVAWFLTKGTVFHVHKVFCELCDHFNLANYSIISYTRNMPNNVLGFFLHPDNDNYHIVHHLFPEISMPYLKRAHEILMTVKEYQLGTHCPSYFFGEDSIIASLTAKLRKKYKHADLEDLAA